ncbi:MAG: FHA domain-containing protein [Myxococcota bacterium]
MSVARLMFRPVSGPVQLLSVAPELRVGRGPHNHLVLPSGDVSWSHAIFRLGGGELVVEDLGSRNGTFVDGVRIERPTRVGLRSRVRIGDADFGLQDASPGVSRALLLEDVAARVRYPLLPPRFTIGGEHGDLQVPDMPPVELGIDDEGVVLAGERLDLPWVGELAGRQVRILSMRTAWTPTLPTDYESEVRQLRIGLEPPRARVFELPACATHTITAEHRVSLLYFLATARLADLEADTPVERCGWRTDAAISIGIWGRAGLESSRNRLNALLYRLRQELTDNGVNPDVVEKKQGWARLAPCEIALDD